MKLLLVALLILAGVGRQPQKLNSYVIPKPPKDQLDRKIFLSSPDSLALRSHIPGQHYFRYEEFPARSSYIKITFSYMIARGTDGNLHCEVNQFHDTPTSWKILSESQIDKVLYFSRYGWKKITYIVNIDKQCTNFAVKFSLDWDSDIGEAWIDNFSIVEYTGEKQ